jgi:hypothetical protein
MKKLLVSLALLTFVAGCRTETQYGECIGIADKQDPSLVYEVSIRNAIVSVFFFQTVIVPVLWLLDSVKCPVGPKAAP